MPESRAHGQRLRRRLALGGVWLLRVGGLLLLLVPIGLVIALSFAADTYTVIPPTGYSVRWYEKALQESAFLNGAVTSLKIALIVTPVSVATGGLAAFALARRRVPFAPFVELCLYSPLMVPLVVTGLAVLALASRVGFYQSFWTIVISHVFITFPYSVRAISATLARYDTQLDEAAASLGARPFAAFRRVTLPIIRPGVFAGALFAFVMSFDDFAVSIFLIGPGTTTLPIAIYQYMEFNLDPAVSAISAMLVLVAVAGTLIVERFIGLDRFLGIRA